MARKITERSELNELLLELRDENVDRNADEDPACEVSEEVQVSQRLYSCSCDILIKNLSK